MSKSILTLIAAITIANCSWSQSLEDANIEFQNENLKKAKLAYLAVIKTNQSPRVALYLGNTYLKLEDEDSARIYFQKAEIGKDAYTYIAKARLAIMDKKDNALVQEFIDKALSVSRKRDPEIFFQAGYLTYRPKITNVNQFVPYFEEAHQQSPSNYFYNLTLGDMYLAQNEGGKAMNKYEEVTYKDPNNVMALIRIGRLFYSAMNYSLAIKSLKKADSINSSYTIVHKELGELYYLVKDYEKASKEFRKYLDLNNNDSKAKGTYGAFLFQLKEYGKAVDEVSTFIKEDTTNYIFYRILAYSNYEIKKMKEAQLAMTNFWKYVEKSKVINLDYNYASKIADANGDTANTIYYMMRAVASDSTNAELQTDYAKTLYNAKRYNDAIVAYNRRLTMQPQPSPLDYYYLGRAYFNLNDFVNSDSTFAKFVKVQPTSPDGYLWRAKSNVELEDKANLKGYAVPHYLKFIEFGASDLGRNRSNLISAYIYLGYVALVQKDNVKAKEWFNKVLELDPSNTGMQEEVKRLK